ncbi:MAG: hypothetical protein LUH40_04500 [Clostridiales bacterium]|nr:hypothetical protein [Clostridiales bacterium]
MELFVEDETAAIYLYCGEVVSDKSENCGSMCNLDGEIIIQKRCLVEPEIHTKLKKTAFHRKVVVTKRIVQPFDIEELLKTGDIEIVKPCTAEYSQGLYSHSNHQSFFAKNLLRKLFIEYQETGTLPDKCSYYV